MKAIDLTGRTFGLLKVIERCENKLVGNYSRRFYKCVCECGTEVTVFSGNLLSGNSKSCGCRKFNGYSGNATHGLSGTFEHRVWKGMRKRCRNKKDPVYKHYGGRGIKVCKRWESFENFLADMGKAPSEKHSIERKKVNRNYCPSNCVWIHRTKQNRNRRDTIRLTHEGETKTLHEWAKHLGFPASTLLARYFRNWPVEQILTKPRKGYALSR